MAQKTTRVCIRFDETEYARISNALGHDYDFELSRWIRKACKIRCEQIEAIRDQRRNATLAEQLEPAEPPPPDSRMQRQRRAGKRGFA